MEKGLLDIAAAKSAVFETFILRPGAVLPNGNRITHAVAGSVVPVVYVSDLAKALVITCLTQPTSRVIENNKIKKVGRNA